MSSESSARADVQIAPEAKQKPKKKRKRRPEDISVFAKTLDFLFYALVVLTILAVALYTLPKLQSLVTAIVIFTLSAAMIVHVSFSKSQKKLITSAPYKEINHKLFSPFALFFSFAAICYMLNQYNEAFFVGSQNASLIDFSMFAFDNILRVIFWDVPEIYGIAASNISHNVHNFMISTLVFIFRALIGLSLIKMVILMLKN